jgi:hypothetical protein
MLTAEELDKILNAGKPYYMVRAEDGKIVREYGKPTGAIVGEFNGRAGKSRKYIAGSPNVVMYQA